MREPALVRKMCFFSSCFRCDQNTNMAQKSAPPWVLVDTHKLFLETESLIAKPQPWTTENSKRLLEILKIASLKTGTMIPEDRHGGAIIITHIVTSPTELRVPVNTNTKMFPDERAQLTKFFFSRKPAQRLATEPDPLRAPPSSQTLNSSPKALAYVQKKNLSIPRKSK